MVLSVVIPAYNEAGSIQDTLIELCRTLEKESIPYEIVVVNDNSKDNTFERATQIKTEYPNIVVYTNSGPNGFGFAIRYGLERITGDCVAIMMADLSDSPLDLVNFYRAMQEHNLDCVFGSRFIKGGSVIDYPLLKKILNRIFNNLIKLVFRIRYNDVTNAFKLYKKETIKGLGPILSPHFNLTVELPLKAIIRGYNYRVLPNSWKNRKHGESKLKLREMGSRYFFILLYCLIEKYFSRGDFKKDVQSR